MPLLNGIKVACEPCIRGHRSTKCNHASERLMVPVRKPGRPLTTCPHVPDGPCDCGHGTVTAAIPRRQTCGCPDDDVSSPSAGGYRVEKRGKTGRSYFGAAGLERMGFFQDNGRDPDVPGGVNTPPWKNQDIKVLPSRPYLQTYTSNVLNNNIMPVPDNYALGLDVPRTATIINQRTYADGTVVFHGNGGRPLTTAEKIMGKTQDGKPIPAPIHLGDIYPAKDLHLDLANDKSYNLYMRDNVAIGTPTERRNAGLPPGLIEPAYPSPHYCTDRTMIEPGYIPSAGSAKPERVSNSKRIGQPPIETLPNIEKIRPQDRLQKHEYQFVKEESLLLQSELSSPAPVQFTATQSPFTNSGRAGQAKSCCVTKTAPTHSHNSSSASSISEPQEVQSSAQSESAPQIDSQDFKSNYDSPWHAAPEMPKQVSMPTQSFMEPRMYETGMTPGLNLSIPNQGIPTGINQRDPFTNSGLFNPTTMTDVFSPQSSYQHQIPQQHMHQQMAQQTPHHMAPGSIFTYPPTYGSYQNPFKPDTYRQNIQQPDNYIPLQNGGDIRSSFFNAPTQPPSSGAMHECCCGDGCECLGCAAHPYNNATREYVRSAYLCNDSAANDFTLSPVSPSRNSPYYAKHTIGVEGTEMLSPTGSNSEEQNLSAANYFFVDYNIGDACGGDTISCRCGDDCQCLGCTIHKPITQPAPDDDGNNKDHSNNAGGLSCCS